MKESSLPVVHIHDFERAHRRDPDVYVQTFRDHVLQYQFIRTPHRHDFYLLALFTHGQGTHTIDFVDYAIRPGSVFFMSPAQVHTWTYSDDTDGYLFFFNAAFYLMEYPARKLLDSPLFHALPTPPVEYLSAEAASDIQELFVRAYQEALATNHGRDDLLRSYLNILLVKLSGYRLDHSSSRLSPHALNQIHQLEQLVETHFLDHKTVKDYAGMMAISEKQLYTICQTTLGKSLQKIVQERLILEAKRWLLHTDLSVAQVADRLNFGDHSYFNRFFRKSTGQTPEQFRRGFL